MIDILKERLLPLRDTGLRSFRGNKNLNYATVWRWATRGKDGIVLETIVTPSGRMTSKEAISRFFRALSAKAGIVDHTTSEDIDLAARQAEIDRASARVAALTR